MINRAKDLQIISIIFGCGLAAGVIIGLVLAARAGRTEVNSG